MLVKTIVAAIWVVDEIGWTTDAVRSLTRCYVLDSVSWDHQPWRRAGWDPGNAGRITLAGPLTGFDEAAMAR